MAHVDLELTGRRYTWYGGRSCSRIDRVLVDPEWLSKYEDMSLKRLNRYLRIPLGANPKRVSTWKPVIQKVDERLKG
ncbi:hypothetical protein PIB30_053119 [Stylosanthes scabra]|uniref:Uncharacterized protein n=1 Tax=Stylosanthes scabra TaxID=79078 RepID=A0ABU6WJG8_9FABA|nr:hypothetical protein [Stylosanthes scabra]